MGNISLLYKIYRRLYASRKEQQLNLRAIVRESMAIFYSAASHYNFSALKLVRHSKKKTVQKYR